MVKKLLSFVLCLLVASFAAAQVTTSSISGKVVAGDGPVIGATVQAIHQPSGTKYGAVTNEKGRYVIQGMRVGGPYKIIISYIGYNNQEYNGVRLSLGEPGVYDANLKENAKQLGEITVTGRTRLQKTGAATNFRQAQIENAPTVDRNVYDIAKLSPLVSISKLGGVSIAGSNNRYNSFQVDGMVSNDVFGLAGSGTNGGQTGANPISMDAIQEIQVVASPFDVRQGGFTGGGINAITKSGTNTFTGTAYTYYNDENFYGRYNQYKEETAKLANQSTKVYGASFGGPIIKDKLFFFANAEYKFDTYPSSYYPESDYFLSTENAQKIVDTYSKYTGGLTDSYGSRNLDTKALSLLGRIDWNINENNKFSIRYQMNDSYKDVYGSGSKTYYFANSGYRMNNKTNSFVAELNSHIGKYLYNEARAGVSFVRDKRDVAYTGPIVEIDGIVAKDGYRMYIGTEYSSGANKLDQDIWTIEDNLSAYLGNHTVTVGTHNEIYKMQNLFIQAANGAYYYNSLDDFVNDNAYRYVYKWSDVDLTGTTKWAGTVKAGQFGAYIQDKWDVSKNFNLTYGIRFDVPVCFNHPTTNGAFNNTSYSINNDAKVGVVPSLKLMTSPRVGFRWFVDNSHKNLIRGGAGLFTGRVPFVWLSNAWNNTGMEMKSTTISKNVPKLGTYGTDAMAAAKSGAFGNQTINTIGKNFKYPQVFRTNLAWETTLPYDIKMTLEGLYSKTLNNVWFENLAIKGNGTVYAVSDKYPNSGTQHYLSNAGDYSAIINLKNTNKGYSYSVSGQLEKSFDFGLDLMASYTFGHSYGVVDGTSSVAYSNWGYNYCVDPNNKNELSHTMFDMPHKVLATASYTSPKYGNGRWSTNVTLTYNGFSGQRYSLTMNEGTDFNGDGQRGNTLLYIPTTEELNAMTFASDEDKTKFENWIEGNDYAKNNRGGYSKRNAVSAPWENHFDLHFAQDFFYLKERGSKVELSLDILNVANMINHDWGTVYSSAYNETILSVTKMTTSTLTDGTKAYIPTYSFLGYSPSKADVSSRWHMQIGLRVTF